MIHNNINDLKAFDMNVTSITNNEVKPLFDKVEKRYLMKLCVKTVVTGKEPIKQYFDLNPKNQNAVIDIDKKIVYGFQSKRYKLITHKQAFKACIEPILSIPEISKLNNTDGIQVFDSNQGNIARREIRIKNEIPLVDKLPQDKAYKSIVMYNSIDSSLAFQYKVGLFRLICENGMMGFDKWFSQYAKHTKNTDIDKIVSGFRLSYETIDNQIKEYNQLYDFKVSKENAIAFLLLSLCSKKDKQIDAKDNKGNYININKKRLDYLTHLYDKYALQLGEMSNNVRSDTGYTILQALTHWLSHTNEEYNIDGKVMRSGRSDDNNLLISRDRQNLVSNAYNSTTGKYIFFTSTRSSEKLQNATIKVKNVLKALLVI